MSVDLLSDANAYEYNDASVPAANFSFALWHNVQAGETSRVSVAGLGDATEQAFAQYTFSGTQDLTGRYVSSTTAALTTEALSTWRYLFCTYVGETTPGVSADGVFTIKYLDDGDSTFQGSVQLTGLSDTTMNRLFLNTRGAGSATGGLDMLVASWKVFDVVISDARALSERLYTENQTGDEYATYGFLSGALTSDSGAGGRTLTARGTGHVYTAAKPNDLTIGGPTGGLTLAADAASYPFGGQDASLKQGHATSADPASYAVTPTDASFARGYVTGAQAAAYMVAAQAAELNAGFTLGSDPAAYAVTGSDAFFHVLVIVTPSPYSITASDATLKLGLDIVAGAATYTLIAQAAELNAGFTLGSDPAAYVVSGAAVALAHDRNVQAGAASVLFAGKSAGAEFGRLLSAAAGSYAATGVDATLTLGGSTVIVPAGTMIMPRTKYPRFLGRK